MKLYIAGPMRGYPNYNFDAFDNARDQLLANGHHPINPADIDRMFEGWDPYPPEEAASPFTKDDFARFMNRDLNAISCCDGVFMLDGWEDSKGANVEMWYARFLGLEVFYEKDGYDCSSS